MVNLQNMQLIQSRKYSFEIMMRQKQVNALEESKQKIF